jgi:enolase
MVRFWSEWVRQYPIVSIEDGLAQDDWESWKAITAELGAKVQLVGDDLLVTNPLRVERAVKERACNAPAGEAQSDRDIKRDALGDRGLQTGVESCRVAPIRRDGRYDDRRFGRGVGVRSDQDRRPGATDRGEYNQLLRIEDELGSQTYAGWKALGSE